MQENSGCLRSPGSLTPVRLKRPRPGSPHTAIDALRRSYSFVTICLALVHFSSYLVCKSQDVQFTNVILDLDIGHADGLVR